ncbi:MAG: hypothetical protein L6Q72_01185 [Burkholderiaceae bacterium]|jgi:hypothetical protein|nr:hypothetical protein [Burkholderiaceae bacterium]GIL05157.1 MAG: hypothetical protein BroJett031_16770 [Betaproteobacteria bacterium]
MTFFEWLAQVCAELGWHVMRAHDMLDDVRWSDMYERGLTPAQAAEHARRDGLA